MLSLIVFLLSTSPVAFSEQLVFGNGAIVSEATWLIGPRVFEESVLRLDWSRDGGSVDPGPFKVEFWMPAHHHDTDTPEIVQLQDEKGQIVVGAYQVSQINLFMEGLWEAKVTLTWPDGREETQTLPVLAGQICAPSHR